jgi:Uncharacterized protein conserved in bacteria
VRIDKDKYGLSWQIVPVILNEMLKSSDRKNIRGDRGSLENEKLDIGVLQKAYDGF